MSSSAWQTHLDAYFEQLRLEEFQKTRKLPRPKTTKLTIALYVLLLLVAIVSFIFILVVFSPYGNATKLSIGAVFIVCVAETYGRLLAVKVVECYQHYASDATRRKCMCVPSCSEYAIMCLKKHELIYSLIKIRKRLFVTCKGFDYIIDNP